VQLVWPAEAANLPEAHCVQEPDQLPPLPAVAVAAQLMEPL